MPFRIHKVIARPGRGLQLCWLLAVLLVLLAPLACSNDDGSDPLEAQPQPGVSVFKPGGFDDIPRYRGSEDAGTRSEDGGVISQSFFVNGADPQMIIDFYRDELQGWDFSGEREVGDAMTAEFTEPDGRHRRLEVSATVAENAGNESNYTTQYSLVLHP